MLPWNIWPCPIPGPELHAIEGILPAHLASEIDGAVKIPVLYPISSDKRACSEETCAMGWMGTELEDLEEFLAVGTVVEMREIEGEPLSPSPYILSFHT